MITRKERDEIIEKLRDFIVYHAESPYDKGFNDGINTCIVVISQIQVVEAKPYPVELVFRMIADTKAE